MTHKKTRANNINLGLVIIVAVVVYLFWINVGAMTATTIEHYGSKATGTPVSVKSVKVSTRDGIATITDLVVYNPAGFLSPFALNVSNIDITLDTASLATNTIVVNTVHASGVKIIDEYRGNTTNLATIVERLHAGTAVGSQPAKTDGTRVVIKHLRLSRIQAVVTSDDTNTKRAITIAPISINNIGIRTNGIDKARLASALLRPLFEHINARGRGVIGRPAATAEK